MKRHKTLLYILFSVFIFIACDFLSAQAFKLYLSFMNYRAQVQLEHDYEANHIATTSHPIYHHDLKPNTDIIRNYGPLNYRHITNSLGLRDNQMGKIPLKTTKPRVVIIGDSFIEGVGFDFNDTVSGIIKDKLPHVDVLNAAVSSYSPSIYLAKTKYLIDEVGLDFDTLVVFIDISDIYDEGLYYVQNKDGIIHSLEKYGKGAIVMESPSILPGFKKLEVFLQNNSLLARFVIGVINHQRGYPAWKSPYYETGINNPRSSWTFNQGLYDYYGKKGLEKGAYFMTQLKNYLDQKNINLIVAVYPWPDQVFHGDKDSIQVKFWEKWAKENNVKLLNYFPYFFDENNKWRAVRKYFIDKDCHWNKDGHKRIAEVFIREFGHDLLYRKELFSADLWGVK